MVDIALRVHSKNHRIENSVLQTIIGKEQMNVSKTQPGVPTTKLLSMLADNLGAFLNPPKFLD